MAQTVEECLVATTRETADGTVVRIVDGTVVALHIGHQVVVQVETEHVATKTCLWHTTQTHGWLCRKEFIGVAIGQYHNHLLSLTLGQKVVEDIVHTADLIIDFLSIGSAADAVEHGVFLIRILLVLRWQIDYGLIGGTETL